MLEALSSLITQFIHTTGYFGIFLLMTLESALIPIPSEVTMPFAGFLANTGSLSLPLVILAGAIGNLFGSLIAYGLGYFLEETVIVSLIKKYGTYILVTEDDYTTSRLWLNKYGSSVAFFSRILPAIRTFISLPAGLAEMNIWKFSLYTFLGSLIWSTVLAYIGFYLGENWHSLEGYFRKFEYVIVAFLIFAALWYIKHKLKK